MGGKEDEVYWRVRMTQKYGMTLVELIFPTSTREVIFLIFMELLFLERMCFFFKMFVII